MGSNVQDLSGAVETIRGDVLPFGAEDVETVYQPPPTFGEPTQAGSAAVIAKSRQSFGVLTFTAAQGSKRYNALARFIQRAKAPGFTGEQYGATWTARGRSLSGRLFPGESPEFTFSETSQEATLTCHLLDVVDVTSEVAGLAE